MNAELDNLDQVLAGASNAGFVAAEERLARAQAAFVVARQVVDRTEQALDNEALNEQAQKQLDVAQTGPGQMKCPICGKAFLHTHITHWPR